MTKTEIYEYLTKRKIPYEVTDHEAVWNMEDLSEVELPHPEADAKNLFVRDDKKQNYFLITVRGSRRVDLKKFRKDHGLRRLSLASAEDLMSILGLIPGAVTPLGLLNDNERRVSWFLDRDFCGGLIGVHPDDNTATVWLKTEDLAGLIRDHGNKVEITSV